MDGFDLRKGINDLQGYDNFPEPKIVISCLEACRRLNEHSVAVRFLEGLRVPRTKYKRKETNKQKSSKTNFIYFILFLL